MGGQAGEVRATGARGRTNRAGPRSSTRGVYTHDAAAAATRREMYFSTIAVFFHLLLGGYYSTTTCGYYSTTARFSFHPASAHIPALGGSDTQRTTLTVGWVLFYHYVWVLFYHCAPVFLDVRFFSRRARFRASTITSSDSREKNSLRFCLFREAVVVERNRGRANGRSAEERTAARASPSGRTQTRADGSRVPGSVRAHREARGKGTHPVRKALLE